MSTPLDQLTPASGPDGNRGPASNPTAPPPDPIPPEDAGSQALAEALRSSFVIVKVIMVLLVVVFFASGMFTVSSQERAIILRFGRAVGAGEEQLLGPGLHWSFPYPIDEIVKIPISQIQTVTSTAGWYAVPPGEPDNENADPGTPSLNPASDGYALTGDGNIIHLKATLRYQINNPLNYTLNFVNASNVLQNALDNALIQASAQFTVDQALKSGILELKEKIVARVRQVVEEQGLGITIQNENTYLHAIAPRQVRKAFNDVVLADNKKRQDIQAARAYASSNLTTATGESNVIVNTSQTESAQFVQMVASDAKYFTNQLPYYRSDAVLFLTRLQTETIGRILTNAQTKMLRMDGGERAIRVNVTREPDKPPAVQGR